MDWGTTLQLVPSAAKRYFLETTCACDGEFDDIGDMEVHTLRYPSGRGQGPRDKKASGGRGSNSEVTGVHH